MLLAGGETVRNEAADQARVDMMKSTAQGGPGFMIFEVVPCCLCLLSDQEARPSMSTSSLCLGHQLVSACVPSHTGKGSPVACNLSNLGTKYFSGVRRQKGKEGMLTLFLLYRDVCHQCATSERYMNL